MRWFVTQSNTPEAGRKPQKGHFMERSLSGEQIELEIIRHSEGLCQEFVVRSPAFCLRRWVVWTVVFNIIGFMLKLHTQVIQHFQSMHFLGGTHRVHVEDPRMMTGVASTVFMILLVRLYYKVTQESLLVVSSLGVQISTKFALGHRTATFYDWDQVHDLVINEAITMHKVIFYLALLLRDHPGSTTIGRLVPLFTHTWPSLRCLQQIYQGAHQVLGQIALSTS